MKNGKKFIGIVAMICLIATLGACLVGCGGMKDYEKKLKKAGYEVTSSEATGSEKESGAEWGVIASKGTDSVTVIKFKNKDDAKKYKDAMSLMAAATGMKVEQDGKIVFIGTEQGIKDAK